MSRSRQTAMKLWTRHGPRPGAGRPVGPHPRVRHRSRNGIEGSHPALVTLKVRPGLPTLRRKDVVRGFERALAALLQRPGFRVVHYSIQSDHVHLLVEAEDAGRLGRGMKALAGRFAQLVNRAFGRKGPLLVDRYHLRVLRTPREVRNALAYVLLNVRKHVAQRGGTLRAGIDPASSGRWFTGWAGGASAPRDPPPVSRPRSWLLAVGWTRWGRIGLAEIPGR